MANILSESTRFSADFHFGHMSRMKFLNFNLNTPATATTVTRTISQHYNSLRENILSVADDFQLMSSNETIQKLFQLSSLLINYPDCLNASLLPVLSFGLYLDEWLLQNIKEINQSALSRSHAIYLAKGHVKLWLKMGLSADIYNLHRARHLFEMFLDTKNKSQWNDTDLSKFSAELDNWLAYIKVLGYLGDNQVCLQIYWI